LEFCCAGCKQVYLVLTAATGALPADFRKTDIYRACLQAGIIPGAATEEATDSAVSGQDVSVPALDFSFHVRNMWCPSCAWLIEEVLRRKRGVVQPRVSFLADAVRLKYLPNVVTPSEIVSGVTKLGYAVSSSEGNHSREAAARDLLLRLGISAILAMNGMMLSWVIYFGLFRDLGPAVVAYLSYPLLLITAPVVFFGGMPILRNAWLGLTLGRVSMDTLIAVSTLAAFFYSLIQMTRGSVHLYFDTAAMLVTIVLLGRYIEMVVRHRVVAGIGLDELGTQKARLLQDGSERWVNADAVRPGDMFLVQARERVPLDGCVMKGEGFLDQSVLTGEPAPVSKGVRDEVMAGSLLVDGEIAVAANRPAAESSLRRMVDLMYEALGGKQDGEELADSVSRFFVPALMGATGLTAGLLWSLGFSGQDILLRCLTMLLISCPCAIGIAVPLIKVAIVGLARKKGILVRNPRALDQFPLIGMVVLDKTGTVTEGRFALHHFVSEEMDKEELFPLLAAIEAGSRHVLAREILRCTGELGVSTPTASEAEELAGRGVIGTVNRKRLFVGNRRLLAQCDIRLPSSLDAQALSWEQNGMTVAFFGWDGRATGLLVFGDPIRPDARELVSWLQTTGMRVLLLSGDGRETTEAVARHLSIPEFSGQMLPSEKAEMVRTLQKQGLKVGMVGDGVNDAAALGQADIGIAFGVGHDLIQEASDLIVTSGRLATIRDAFVIAALSVKRVRQNLAFALLYNATAVPVAAAGLLNPLIAVLAMFASSLTVIGNALRIARK
jgi:heavy metal translocating P-type ATPase